MVKFEGVFYRKWCATVEDIADGVMEAPLLTRDAKTGQFALNLVTGSLTIIREARALEKFGLKIPKAASDLLIQESSLKVNIDR